MVEFAVPAATRVAIIGAGIAGLACATALKAAGVDSVLFDKGRRPGGRVSSLRLEAGAWDFGAPFVRASDPDFAKQLATWAEAGVVSPWPAGPRGAWVGMPAMAAIVGAQCAAHAVNFAAQIQRAEHRADGWYLHSADTASGPFAALILALPAEQAAAQLSLLDLGMAREAAAVRSQARWSAMLAFDQPLTGLPAFLQDNGDLAWAARESSKPGRKAASDCWVLHASSDWSARNLERDPAAVAHDLLALFANLSDRPLPEPAFLKAHRWRFACPFGQRGTVLWNPQELLGACGDWCVAPGIEGAWLSGTQLAGLALRDLPAARPITALS
jgi:renalase